MSGRPAGTHWHSVGREWSQEKFRALLLLPGFVFVGLAGDCCFGVARLVLLVVFPPLSASFRFACFSLEVTRKGRLRNLSLAGHDPRTAILGTPARDGRRDGALHVRLFYVPVDVNIANCDFAFVNFLNSEQTTESAKKEACVMSDTTATVVVNHRS